MVTTHYTLNSGYYTLHRKIYYMLYAKYMLYATQITTVAEQPPTCYTLHRESVNSAKKMVTTRYQLHRAKESLNRFSKDNNIAHATQRNSAKKKGYYMVHEMLHAEPKKPTSAAACTASRGDI